jgi:pyruvate formate lyase activating enzyme
MTRGKIFSIEEFSTYDGPGIRSTVFLKGCPLRCVWCHNPEGQSFSSEMARSPSGCLGCGACLAKGKELTGREMLVPESVAVCPRRLVRICGEELTSEELVARLEKNIRLLNMGGGGVTFSGGEPLAQGEFLIECLALLRGKTHRAIQTCGFADSELFRRALCECEYVLYDLKHMDGEIHRRYTGVDNGRILENYGILAKSGVKFVTRIPLIPTVNDTVENIRATAEFMSGLGVRYIELLPYNKMAGGKYLMLGREYKVDFDGALVPQARVEIFNEYRIEVKVL